LTLDRDLLRELLGEGELRELFSPDELGSLELELQGLVAGKRATSADAVHDLLRRVGPLTLTELQARTEGLDLDAALGALHGSRRVVVVRIDGVERYAAIEDVSRLRDALGVQPPPGVPES